MAADSPSHPPRGDGWAAFAHDPRDPAHADLRAADADRDVVHSVLSAAYTDGRLDRAEFDERTDAVPGCRTLGAVLPLVSDLLPRTPATRGVLAVPSASEIERAAQQEWDSRRRSAVFGFLGPTLICWVIWFAIGGGFPWPAIVTVVTGLNMLRTLTSREEIINDERRRLEKKAAKKAARPVIPPPPDHPRPPELS